MGQGSNGARGEPKAGRVVLHVLPTDVPRGAQIHARALLDHLEGAPDRHVALTLFAAPEGGLRPEHCLGVDPAKARTSGISLRAAWRLRRYLSRNRPDVLVSHGGEILKYMPFAVPRSIPVVYHRVGTAGHHLDTFWRRNAYRILVWCCTQVVAVSDEVADEATDLFGVDRSLIVVIENGRDIERFRPHPALLHGGADELVALYAGHVSAGKGADRFVDLIGTLRAEGVAIRGVVAGDGPLVDSLAEQAAEAGVTLLGHHDAMAELMAASDVFVFPSIDREGMPGVLIEAGLSGIPSIASDMPGVNAVVVDGVTGFVVPTGDRDQMLDRLRQLAGDQVMRTSMGEAARTHCAANFSVASMARRWQAVLERVAPA